MPHNSAFFSSKFPYTKFRTVQHFSSFLKKGKEKYYNAPKSWFELAWHISFLFWLLARYFILWQCSKIKGKMREREEKKKSFGEERATAELWFVSLNDRRSSRRSLSIVRLRHCGTTHRRPFICHCSGEPKSMALKDDRSSLKSYGRQKKTSGARLWWGS